MKNFLNPKTIAVIGASDKKSKIGNILVKNLKNKKNQSKIFPINPRHKIIEGMRAYASVLEVNKKIDLAIIAIPSSIVLAIVDECIKKNIHNLVIISAGFSESGKDGKKREAELKKMAQENNLNILGPNCLGFINANKKINASFAKKEVLAGKIGLISQSGAFVTGLLDMSKQEEVGFSKIITLGNKVTLDEIDCLKYLANDPKTEIIGLYLENITRGRLFYNTVAKITKKKPVLILKAGSSEKVQKAILSHTGSMAGKKDVVKKAFLDSGALYFENISEFWKILRVFYDYKPLRNNQLVVLTNAGGPGVVATDLIEQAKNIDFYNFSSKEKESLEKQLPTSASVENPVDILGDANAQRYENALKKLIKFKKVGGVITLITPQAQTKVEEILKAIAKKNQESLFPIIPVLIGKDRKKVFKFPVEVIDALDQLSIFNKLQSQVIKTKKEPPQFNVLASSEIKKTVNKIKESDRKVFFYEEALKLMKYYQVETLNAQTVDEKFKFPKNFQKAIIKVDDPKILHKAAQDGVRIGIKNQNELKQNLKQLRRKFKKEKIIIQEQVEKGVEIIIGIKKDANFGPILMCGLGGILTEIIDEKLLWILPAGKRELEKDLKNSKIGQVFKKEDLKLEQLVEALSRVASIGWQNNWLKELDINPMFFYSDNKKPLAVDVKVKF